MNLRRKAIIRITIFIVVLLVVTVGSIFFFKVLRNNGLNLTDVFVNKRNMDNHGIICVELPQIQDLYSVGQPAKGYYRTFNPCVFNVPTSTLNRHRPSTTQIESCLDQWCAYRISNYTTCKGRLPQVIYVDRSQITSRTLIRAPSGCLFEVQQPQNAGNNCVQGVQDIRVVINGSSMYLIGNEASGPDCRRQMTITEVALAHFERQNEKRRSVTKVPCIRKLKLQASFGNERNQKNWMPFVMDGDIHFVYSINPHIILRWDGKGKCVKIAETSNDLLSTELRGGSQVIEVTKRCGKKSKDLYLAVAHIRDHIFEYTTCFYAFERSYPYRVCYITDPFVFDQDDSKGKRIQFAAGLAKSRRNGVDYLQISYGEHDCTANLCVIKEQDVLRSLKRV